MGASPFVLQPSSLTLIRTCCMQNIGGWISGQSFETSKWKAASKSSAKLEHSYALVWRSSTVDIAACFLTDFEPLLSLQPQTRHRSSNLQLHAVFITNSMWLVSLYGLYRARGACGIHSMTNHLFKVHFLPFNSEFIRRDLEKRGNQIVEF